MITKLTEGVQGEFLVVQHNVHAATANKKNIATHEINLELSRHMGALVKVNLQDPLSAVRWLEKLHEIAYHTHATFDHSLVIDTFDRAGYSPGMNTESNFDPSCVENVLGHLIGQSLAMIHHRCMRPITGLVDRILESYR